MEAAPPQTAPNGCLVPHTSLQADTHPRISPKKRNPTLTMREDPKAPPCKGELAVPKGVAPQERLTGSDTRAILAASANPRSIDVSLPLLLLLLLWLAMGLFAALDTVDEGEFSPRWAPLSCLPDVDGEEPGWVVEDPWDRAPSTPPTRC